MEHAVIILLLAIAGYFARSARQQSSENSKLLNSHLEQHVMDVVAERNPSPGAEPLP